MSEYYITCTGQICKCEKQEVYGVLFAPKVFKVVGFVGVDHFKHVEIK